MKGTWDGDRDPLAALRRGRPDLFEAFVEQETGWLIGFFKRLGAHHQEAEDLVQEVVLKLFRSSTTYEPRSAFSAYALRVARNAWIDRQRRRAARPDGRAAGVAGEDAGDESPALARLEARSASPSLPAESADEAARLKAALASISDSHREVFELAVVQQLPYARISEVLEVPVGTVKSRVFHAIRRLRVALGEDEDEAPGRGVVG